MHELFSQYGTVELVSVPRNRDSGQPRGFAFVDMSTPEEVEKCIAELDETVVGGRLIRVTKSKPKGQITKQELRVEPEGTQKIYVGNISFG